jgi:hypothetical protein
MSAQADKTDDSKLVTTDTVYVSADGGTTNEAFPKPNVEYDFCVDVTNRGQLPSGLCFVRFTLTGDEDWRRTQTCSCIQIDGAASVLKTITRPLGIKRTGTSRNNNQPL